LASAKNSQVGLRRIDRTGDRSILPREHALALKIRAACCRTFDMQRDVAQSDRIGHLVRHQMHVLIADLLAGLNHGKRGVE
jgi:hypothetical protein